MKVIKLTFFSVQTNMFPQVIFENQDRGISSIIMGGTYPLLLHQYNKKFTLSYDINLKINSVQYICLINVIKKIVKFPSSFSSTDVVIFLFSQSSPLYRAHFDISISIERKQPSFCACPLSLFLTVIKRACNRRSINVAINRSPGGFPQRSIQRDLK